MLTVKLPLAFSLATIWLSFPNWAFSLPEDPSLLCFRRLPSGAVQSLESMCPQKKLESEPKPSEPKSLGTVPSQIKKKVEISNAVRQKLDFLTSNFNGTRLVVTFKNNNRTTLRSPSISYTARKGKRTVDTGKIRGNRDEIGPREEVGFKTILDEEADVIELIAVDSE